MSSVDLQARIPNNVDLAADARLQRALEQWLPGYLEWWRAIGPDWPAEREVYLRTAVSVEKDGWANFGYVKMPDYRWGIFLAPAERERKVGFGDHADAPAWQEVPGEYRNLLRRLIVTQADTEPASVEQQRRLSATAPSLYDCRNLFQVNVEEGRHLWAMVYLLHRHFGRDGRDEAEDLLARRSGDPDKPRILGAFNAPMEHWLSFFLFTTFTDRDGKYQLLALAESGFDPLARTCRFMLTEEVHHMFVGETGVQRVLERTVEVLRQHPGRSPRESGALDLELIQRHINYWFSISVDLFGGEISSNAAEFFASGLKGRCKEEQYADHLALEGSYRIERLVDGKLASEDVPLRNAMNEVLRDDYIQDNQRVVDRWNKVLEQAGLAVRLRLPHRRFNRQIGIHAGSRFDVEGRPLAEAEWQARKHEWLPSDADRDYVLSLMRPVMEAGKIASWIAPPAKGINGQAFGYQYVL